MNSTLAAEVNSSIPELNSTVNRTVAAVTNSISELNSYITDIKQNYATPSILSANISSLFLNTTIWTSNSPFTTTTESTAHVQNTDGINLNDQNSPYSSSEIILTVLFVLIFLVGTFGNAFIFYHFGVKKKARRSIPELLFSYLAVVDFVASVINPTVFAYLTLNRFNWGASEFSCRFTLSLGAIFTTMSGGIFIVIALDRQRTIVFPFKSHFKRSTIRWCVLGAVLYSVSMNFHYALRLHIIDGRCLIDDVTKLSYWFPTLVCFLVHDFTLLFVFTFTNVRIFRHIRSKGTAFILGALWEKRKRDNAKIIRLLVVLATVYFVLTLPRDIFQMVYSLSWVADRGIQPTMTLSYINSWVKAMSATNSSVNIFIYYRMHRGFRKEINKVLCCVCGDGDGKGYLETTKISDGSPVIQRSYTEAELDRRHINDAVGRKRTNLSPSRIAHPTDDDYEKVTMTEKPLMDNSDHDDEEIQPMNGGKEIVEKSKFAIRRMRKHSDPGYKHSDPGWNE